MSAREILVAARALIADPAHWTKGRGPAMTALTILQSSAAMAERDCSAAWSLVREDARLRGYARLSLKRFLSADDRDIDVSMFLYASESLGESLRQYGEARARLEQIRAQIGKLQ